MSNVIPFKFKTNDVRVINDDSGEPWFVLSDVCRVLDISNPSNVANRLDEDERSTFHVGRQGFAVIINESGLYSTIFRSNKSEAKRFKKWVTSEVLPSIRKTGTYSVTQKPSPKPPKKDHSFFKLAMQVLRPDPSSKLVMLQRYGASQGVETGFLPDYTASEGVHHSMTEQLKKHNSEIKAHKANSVLIALGILEVMSRNSKSKKKKEFKVVTKKGEKYGINKVSPASGNQTQPHWYDETFTELLGMIEAKINEAEAREGK